MINRLKPKSEFLRNVLTLMTGTTIAQAIPIAISPILTRIYTPEDFGVFALYIGIVSFIAIVVTARYEMAIVLPKSDEEAINIVALSFIIMMLIVSFITVSIFFFHKEILFLLNSEEIGNLLYLTPVSILLAGLNQIFNYWANRKKYFKSMSSSQIGQSIGVGVGQSSFGFLTLNGGLIFGNIVGRLISTYILVKKFITHDVDKLKYINKTTVVQQMKEHKDSPLANSLHALSEILRISGTVILISSFYGLTTLGFYALAIRILQVPMGLISSSIGHVLYSKLGFMKNENLSMYSLVKNIFIKIFLISIPVFIILYIIIPDAFALIFGVKWKIAGEYSRLLLPYIYIGFLLSPFSEIPIIFGKQKQYLYISFTGNIFVLMIIIFGHYLEKSITDILWFISFILSIQYLYIMIWIFTIVKKNEMENK